MFAAQIEGGTFIKNGAAGFLGGDEVGGEAGAALRLGREFRLKAIQDGL